MANGTKNSAIIGATPVYGVRELHSMDQVATFDAGNADASIEPTTLRFVDDANEAIKNAHLANPLEAPLFVPKVEGYSIVADQKYLIDYRTMRMLSPVEREAQVFRLSSAPSFEKNASGVLMQLLKDQGFLVDSDFKRVPYVIETRKRMMDQIAFTMQLVQIQKSLFDEIFKLVNIAGDILSGAALVTIPAAVVAVANLISTLAQITVLIIKIINLINDSRELLTPPVRYHFGVNLYQYLLKGCQYLNVNLELGAELEDICRRITLLPSKSDEVGEKTIPVNSLDTILNTNPQIGDGLLRPSDFGYSLGEAFQIVKNRFNCRSAIKDNTYHLRTKKDPFWNNSPSYVIPNVLIEEALGYSNGSYEYNYNELVSRTLISYAKDDTDYFTLTDTNNRMAEVIYDHAVTDKKRSLLSGLDKFELDYALCVRKGAYDGIFTGVVSELKTLVNSFQGALSGIMDNYSQLQQASLGLLPSLSFDNWVREGALLVENHYFDKPKFVLQDPVTGRIPANFATEIGADALWSNWHSFNCMAAGWKSASNPNLTDQKLIFRNVKIPFGIKDWEKTIVNSNCISPNYGSGEFLSIKWNTANDFAIVDFFIYQTWAPNLTAALYIIKPTNEKILNLSLWGS